MIRFLADESCDFRVVRALRKAGCDVIAISEEMTRSVDRELMERANHERRILLTEDKDFGWLVYVSVAKSSGVVLIRFPGNARDALAATVVELVKEYGSKLHGAFTVMQPGYTRIRHKLER